LFGLKVKKSFGATNFMQTIKNASSIHEAIPKHNQSFVLPSKSLGLYPSTARRYSIDVVNQTSFETQESDPGGSFEVQKPGIEGSEIVQPIVIEGTVADKPEKDSPNKNEIAKVRGNELN
jgi:hypothetical protein